MSENKDYLKDHAKRTKNRLRSGNPEHEKQVGAAYQSLIASVKKRAMQGQRPSLDDHIHLLNLLHISFFSR